MASIAAEKVAQEVLKSLGNSRKPVLRKIAREAGYSEHTADSPKNITETKSYQRVITPIAREMEKVRTKALKELQRKDLTEVEYIDLASTVNKMTHDIQILTGGATENIAVKPLATLEELRGNSTETNG